MTAPRGSRTRLAMWFVAALALAGYGWYHWRRAHAPYEWSGTVETHAISLGSRAGGRVHQVLVKEGDRVGGGDPLVVLEAGDWPAQLQQAQARLAVMAAVLDKLRAGARPEELAAARARTQTAQAALQETVSGARSEQIGAAEARLAAQDIAVDKARSEAERLHELAAAGAAVPVDVDNADLALRSTAAQRDVLAHQLDELKHGSRREQVAQATARATEQRESEHLLTSGTRAEDLRAAEAEVTGAQGRVDQIQSMLDELTIRAPLAARVEALDLRPGDMVAPSDAAVTVVEDDRLYIRVYVPETELGHVAIGQPVAIAVDSFPDQSFGGVVQHINSVGEYSPRNLQTADERADQVFATRIGITRGADHLRAGMAATITVPRD